MVCKSYLLTSSSKYKYPTTLRQHMLNWGADESRAPRRADNVFFHADAGKFYILDKRQLYWYDTRVDLNVAQFEIRFSYGATGDIDNDPTPFGPLAANSPVKKFPDEITAIWAISVTKVSMVSTIYLFTLDLTTKHLTYNGIFTKCEPNV